LQTGEINLYTVRHEPGKVHYTFAEHHAAVSALALSSDEKSVFSGSHDGHALVGLPYLFVTYD
jgi:transcriptional activator SPT8